MFLFFFLNVDPKTHTEKKNCAITIDDIVFKLRTTQRNHNNNKNLIWLKEIAQGFVISKQFCMNEGRVISSWFLTGLRLMGYWYFVFKSLIMDQLVTGLCFKKSWVKHTLECWVCLYFESVNIPLIRIFKKWKKNRNYCQISEKN